MENFRNLVLIKLGGSVITDKSQPYTERREAIRRLCSEIKEGMEERPDLKFVVGHGGGSYPHHSASKYQTHKGLVNEESYEGIAMVQRDAASLNRIVLDCMLEANIPALSIQPSSACIAKDGEIHGWNLENLKKALDLGLTPIPYGDVALDHEKGCCILSTEKLLSHIAKNLGADKLVLCSDVEGVFTGDPSEEESELVRKITPANYEELKKELCGASGEDVTGGMLHKVETCLELVEEGIDCQIVNGEKKGNLKRSIKGDENLGTLITKN